MKRSTAVWLIIGGVLILAGAIIFCTVMSMLNWNFKSLDTNKYETNVYESDKSVGEVKIDVTTADVTFKPSDDGKIKVVCYENTKIRYTVTVDNGVLTITENDYRKWYDHIGIKSDSPRIDVYLPTASGYAIDMDITTGDVSIAKDFKLLDVEIRVTTGDVKCLASSAESIKIENTTGDVTIENTIVEKDVYVHYTSSDVTMRNVTVGEHTYIKGSTGDVAFHGGFGADLNVKITTGDVKLDNFDAREMNVETTTGDVTGTLRTSKLFTVDTTTGDVTVEKYIQGYECKVKTTTGDVSIECLAIDEAGPFWWQ